MPCTVGSHTRNVLGNSGHGILVRPLAEPSIECTRNAFDKCRHGRCPDVPEYIHVEAMDAFCSSGASAVRYAYVLDVLGLLYEHSVV